MTSVSFRAAALGQLRSADIVLSPGRYVVLSSEHDALSAFVALASGRTPPRSGSVTLDGVAPFASPAVRRKIAALFEDEALPPARTLEGALVRALAARHADVSAAPRLLAAAGLSDLASRPPSALSARETRSAALALALAHDSAALLVLHEPLTTSLETPYVLSRLAHHTERGAIVVAATSSSADADLLGGNWLCVELGRLQPTAGSVPRLGQGPWQDVLVEASDPRALTLALHDPALGLSIEPTGRSGQLKIGGPALDTTVRLVIAAARQHAIEVTRIEPALPPVEALMAARAGFARGAYEASRLAAHQALAPAPPSLPPPGSVT